VLTWCHSNPPDQLWPAPAQEVKVAVPHMPNDFEKATSAFFSTTPRLCPCPLFLRLSALPLRLPPPSIGHGWRSLSRFGQEPDRESRGEQMPRSCRARQTAHSDQPTFSELSEHQPTCRWNVPGIPTFLILHHPRGPFFIPPTRRSRTNSPRIPFLHSLKHGRYDELASLCEIRNKFTTDKGTPHYFQIY
jgi:hypothetical protein